MRAEWDESYFDGQREEPSTYWVCFWSGGPDSEREQAAMHDPHRITGARSVEQVLAWLHHEKSGRRFELYVETVDHAESREDGWVAQRKLIRLCGDFHPGGSVITISLTTDT